MKKLAKVIVRHAHYSPAHTVLLPDWHALNQDYMLKECRATPYALAALSCIGKTIKWIGRERATDIIHEFVFEEGDTGFGDLCEFLRLARVAAMGQLDSVCPVPKPKSLEPLQAADFAAWEQRRIVARSVQGLSFDPRESVRELSKVDNDWGVIKKDTLIEYCAWLDVPRREPAVFRSQQERARWRPRPFRRKASTRKQPT